MRVSPKTVYRWIKDRKLSALQLGPRIYRVEPDAVRQFLQTSGYGDVPPPGADGDADPIDDLAFEDLLP